MNLTRTRVLHPIDLPAQDHPLYSMALHYHILAESAREAERICERLAPTPLTMAGDHPADALTGYERDTYHREDHRCSDLIWAAQSAHRALDEVADLLGGW